MTQHLASIALVVRDYDEAIARFGNVLGFELIEDAVLGADRRWVMMAPPGAAETRLLLAEAASPEQISRIGNQTGGRVFLFLRTNDFARDHALYKSRGVKFVRDPSEESYGTVAAFEDLYGNLWDLVQPTR